MSLAIFEFSHIYTKISAKVGNMLDEDDYDELINKKSVTEIAAYLKEHTNYADLLSDINVNKIHRSQLEQVFERDILSEAIHLMKFSSGNVDHYLKLFIIKYEIENLKMIIRVLNANDSIESISDSVFRLGKYSTVDIDKLLTSRNMEDFLNNISGTQYHNIISPVLQDENINMFNVEMALDMYFFSMIYKADKRYFNSTNHKVIIQTMGKELDLINMLWIYRCKKYYNLQPEMIYRYLIPYSNNIKKDMISKMIETESIDELLKIYSKTTYAWVFEPENDHYYDKRFWEYILSAYYKTFKTNPFSIASIVFYMHYKEVELKNLVTIVECIRYNIPKNQIKDYIIRLN